MTGRRWPNSILVGAAALNFLANGVSAQQTPRPSSPPATAPAPATVAAMVNGEPINVEEVEGVLKLVPPAPAAATETQKRQMQREAVEMLIDDVLIRQFL